MTLFACHSRRPPHAAPEHDPTDAAAPPAAVAIPGARLARKTDLSTWAAARLSKAGMRANPHLDELARLHARGALTPDQQDRAGQIARFHVLAPQRPRNMDLQFDDAPLPDRQDRTGATGAADPAGVGMPAMTRRASFMLSAGVLDDIGRSHACIAAAALRRPRSAEGAASAERVLLQAGLAALRINCELQQALALKEAQASGLPMPITLDRERFRVFLGKRLRILQEVVAGCRCDGPGRLALLEAALTRLAQDFCAALPAPPLAASLKVRLAPDGEHGLRVGYREHIPLPDLEILIATAGIDQPSTSINESVRLSGLGRMLHGFEHRAPSTRQAAFYLQVLFQQLTRFESLAGAAPQTYAGDPVLGDAPDQRHATVEPVLRLAWRLRQPPGGSGGAGAAVASAPAGPLDAALTDPALRTWLQRHQVERDLLALIDPGMRLAILQEDGTRQALLQTPTFRFAP